MENVEKITVIPVILNDIKSQNPKIRYGCLYCISEFSTGLKDEFTELYAEKVIPSICTLVTSDNVLRCQLQGYDSLQSFITESSEELIENYTQSILEALFANFAKSDKECPQSLRGIIIDCLNELISKNNSFKQYSDNI